MIFQLLQITFTFIQHYFPRLAENPTFLTLFIPVMLILILVIPTQLTLILFGKIKDKNTRTKAFILLGALVTNIAGTASYGIAQIDSVFFMAMGGLNVMFLLFYWMSKQGTPGKDLNEIAKSRRK